MRPVQIPFMEAQSQQMFSPTAWSDWNAAMVVSTDVNATGARSLHSPHLTMRG
jgi:hypothetical protein